MLAVALVVSVLSLTQKPLAQPRALLRLRGGGLPSVEDTQKAIGVIGLASGIVGFAFPKENLEVYEFASPLEADSVSFGRMNYAAQIVVGTMLLSPENLNSVFAACMYGWAAAEADNLKAPRLPLMAWAAFIWAAKPYAEYMPEWLLPLALVASGAHGTMDPHGQAAMYKLGTRGLGPKDKAPGPLSAQATAMAQLANNAWLGIGLYLLAPLLGLDSAQAFALYCLTNVASVVKMLKLDGGEDLFNPVGAWAWAALFGGAGLIALSA